MSEIDHCYFCLNRVEFVSIILEEFLLETVALLTYFIHFHLLTKISQF